MNSDISLLNLFLSFLGAFIVKDFYDIFIADHIRHWLKKYKIYITMKKEEKP